MPIYLSLSNGVIERGQRTGEALRQSAHLRLAALQSALGLIRQAAIETAADQRALVSRHAITGQPEAGEQV